MKLLVCFDLHDTLVSSTKAWLDAYKQTNPNEYKLIKKDYKSGMSRKKICKKYDINYEYLEEIYRKKLHRKKLVMRYYNLIRNKYNTCIITNASSMRARKDLEHCNIKYNKLYTSDDGLKPNSKYISRIMKENESDFLILIGNQDEDILLLPKTISYLIERDIQIISIYNKIRRIKESKVMNKILLLSGPNKKTGYDQKIKEIIKENLSGKKSIVFISANPDNYEKNDIQVYGNENSLGIIKMLEECNVKVSNTCIIDNRNIKDINNGILLNADIIYLMGGDPILQNEFVINNNLLNFIKKSNSFIIGVSAGSMNLAKNAFIPKYELNPKAKFIKGFELCDLSIIPHFNTNDLEQVNEAKENSNKHELIGLPNDSAIFISNNKIEYINKYYLYK